MIKYSTRGVVLWQIQHSANVYGAFTDLLVLRGRTDYFDSILDRCFRLSVLAALTEWIHKAMQKNKPTQ